MDYHLRSRCATFLPSLPFDSSQHQISHPTTKLQLQNVLLLPELLRLQHLFRPSSALFQRCGRRTDWSEMRQRTTRTVHCGPRHVFAMPITLRRVSSAGQAPCYSTKRVSCYEWSIPPIHVATQHKALRRFAAKRTVECWHWATFGRLLRRCYSHHCAIRRRVAVSGIIENDRHDLSTARSRHRSVTGRTRFLFCAVRMFLACFPFRG